jgi:hypothetical protein
MNSSSLGPGQSEDRDLKSRNCFTNSDNFQVAPLVKEYSYYILYSGSQLVADVGGYLGLFLGLSAFGLVELLEKLILTKRPTITEVPEEPEAEYKL